MRTRAVRLSDSAAMRQAAVGIAASVLCAGALLYGYTQGFVEWQGLGAVLWGCVHAFGVVAVVASIHRISSLGGPSTTLTVVPALAVPGEGIDVHWTIGSEGIDISGVDLDLVEGRETLVQGEVQSERDVRKTRIGPAEGDEDSANGGVAATLPEKLTLDLNSRDQRLVWYVEMRVRYTRNGPKRKRLTRRFRIPFEDQL